MSAGDPWVGTVIDVSKWQSSLPDLSGVLGVIARAGIGTKPDAMFTTHIANARKAGLWVGSYWFNWGTLSVSDQVNAYIAREREVGGVSLHVIDWESADGFTAAQTADFIRIYKARTGDPIGLYASESWFRDLGQDFNWIANYSREPIKPYDMWQYGPFRGVDGNNARDRILQLVKESNSNMSIVGEITLGPLPPASYVVPKIGAKVVDSNGLVLRVAVDGDKYPRIGDTGNYHAFRVPGGKVAYVAHGFVNPDLPMPSVTDTTPFDQSFVDAAVAAQKQEDQAAIDAANAALQVAAATERERIALSLAATEADRVRNA